MPEIIGLWAICRNPETGGLSFLPDEGGAADQSPFVLECFSILDRALKDGAKGRA